MLRETVLGEQGLFDCVHQFCRRVDGYEPTKEACGFHDKKCKIRVWSIYLKKYYLNGVIFNLTKKCDIIITTKDYCRL